MDVGFLLDVAPDPPPLLGRTGLTVLVLIVLGLAAIMIAGFAFLLIRIKRRRRRLNELAAAAQPVTMKSPE
jgi:hypothetical protein